MEVAPEQQRSRKGLRLNRSIFNTIALVILLIGASAGVGYGVGYKTGQRDGAKQAVKKVTDYLNPLNAISDSPLFPGTIIGKVSSISKGSLELKMANGQSKKVILNENTKYTKTDKAISFNEIKKDADVTVFTTGKDSAQTATRVVLR